jgi:uncharacterized membrane protein (DUF4010 family)
MNNYFLHYPVGPIALKIAVAVGIGMLIGMERKWAHKEAGVRTFAIVALLGTLSAIISLDIVITSMVGVFLLIIAMNVRTMRKEDVLEVTTSAALLVNYILGVLIGLGHIFTPVAGAIVMSLLLALKTEFNRFTGGLQLPEIRSAILLGLIGFVIYPLMPDQYIDPWHLFNPHDAWLSVIAISGIAFVNYVCLKVFHAGGLYWSAIFGGLVNSSATVAELSTRAQTSGLSSRVTVLSLLTTIAMFARNLLLIIFLSPISLPAVLLPLIIMSIIAGLWLWGSFRNQEPETENGIQPELQLDTPISLKKVLGFGLLFVVIQVGGELLTRLFGRYGMLATGFFGGLVSSASTTAAAATLASHGQLAASLAGSVAVLSSLASAIINLPIIWRTIENRAIVRKVTIQLITIVFGGLLMVGLDQVFLLSDGLVKFFKQ